MVDSLVLRVSCANVPQKYFCSLNLDVLAWDIFFTSNNIRCMCGRLLRPERPWRQWYISIHDRVPVPIPYVEYSGESFFATPKKKRPNRNFILTSETL